MIDAGDGIEPSFFEVTTAVAFLAFARTPADAAVVEVGLGGRLDATNVVEHPELVAERIGRFAGLVGRERVIASTDCGLGGRVHRDIAWAKLETLAQGAAIASKQLF